MRSVPGVRSEALRYVWTQTGDGHDANAKVQALVAYPGLLPLWMDKPELNRQKRLRQF